MTEELIRNVIIFLTISALALASLDIIGASIYDARQIKFKKLLTGRVRKKRYLISLIVPIRDQSNKLDRCLSSIAMNNYPVEVIVISDGTTPGTEIINLFAEKNPQISIKSVTTGQPLDLTLYVQYSTGELIMVLGPDYSLSRDALERINDRFELAEDQYAIETKKMVAPYSSISGLFEQYQSLASLQHKKLQSLLGYSANPGSSCVAYPSMLLGTASFPRTIYANDAVIYFEAAKSYWGLLYQYHRRQIASLTALSAQSSWVQRIAGFYRQLLLLSAPMIMTYAIYLAFVFNSAFLFSLSWIALTLYLILAVWSDENIKISRKISLSLLAPSMYSLFYIMSFMQITALASILVKGLQRVSTAWRILRRA